MSSYYGIDTTSSSNFFDSYFNTNNNTNSSKKSNDTSGISNLFANSGSGVLGDYALIQSGSYKKLMQAYYKSVSESGENEDSTKDMLTAKSDASTLNKTAAGLVDNKKLFESLKDKDGKEILDEDGNKTYDRDGIKKAVQSFVDEYNALLDSAGELNNTSVLSKTLRMVKDVDVNSNLLNKVGIKIGSDNKLTIDEEKFAKADISDLKTLFNGKNSLADKISQKSAQIYNITNSNAYTNTRAATYTFDGTTSVLGTKNGYLNDLI